MLFRKLAAVSFFVALGASAWPRAAGAQGLLSSGECTTDNLLARRLPVGRQDARGDLRLVTDGAAGPEGAQWDAPVAVILDTSAGSITYDLGSVRPVSSFLLQADANDTYKIFGADENRTEAFKLLVEIDSVVATAGHGLRTRTATIDATPVRYLRVGEALGDGSYSIGEFAAYCRAPTPFPPKLTITDAPPAKVIEAPWYKFTWWENDASSRFEMGLALGALALLGWGLWLAKKGMPNFRKKLRDGLLIVVGLLSFCAYWNFFCWHFGNYTHMWDTFHYYIGSKYFNEISYDRLYECVAVADSEEPGLRRRVELRKIMNLRTNMMISTSDVLAHPELCKAHFTPERWSDFRRDVGYFRNHHDVKRWEEAQTDHGYNGTPVWNIVGTTLSNTGPASDRQIWYLTRIDPFFILGIIAMSWWAFGWRTMCVALAVFATNFPSRFYWTGGSLLRWDWLFYFVGGFCLVKKERPFLGGFFLGYSTLLRIFPMFVFSGPILVIIRQLCGKPSPDRPWWKPEPWTSLQVLWKRVDRRFVSILGGAALAAVVLVPISLVTSSGIAGYRAFIFNTQKHKETPLTNYMGLRTVVGLQPVRGRARAQGRSPGGSLGHLEAHQAGDLPPPVPDLPGVRGRVHGAALRGLARRRAVGGLLPGRHHDGGRCRADLLLLLVPVRDRVPLSQATRDRRHPAGRDGRDRLHRLGAHPLPARRQALGELQDAAVAGRTVHVDVGRDAGRVHLDPLPIRQRAGLRFGEADDVEAVPAVASGTPRRRGVNRNRQRSGRRSR